MKKVLYFLMLLPTVFLGQVGIGTTSPSEALDVETNDATKTAIDINNSSTGDPMIHFQISGIAKFTFGIDNDDSDKLKIGTTAVETGTSITIDANGDVGFGDSDPGYVVEVEGPININGTTANTDYYRIGGNHALSTPNTKNLYAGNGAGATFNSGGTDNVFLGYNAGNDNTTGDNNVFIGSGAGDVNTVGNANVCIGIDAGGALDEDYNTFVGASAGKTTNSGTRNCFYGYSAGELNTTGVNNVFIGYQAGEANTSAQDNVFVGYTSGQLVTTGNYNTFMGSFSGVACTESDYSTIIGYEAGLNTTTGDNNTFLGYQAGENFTTGGSNVCIGNQAGPAATSTSSGELYIDNSQTNTPLVYGDFTNDRLTVNGTFIHANNTIAADDVTPSVSGANVWTTSANTGATAITDLDNPTVGSIVYIIGGSNTNSSTIADGGNFNLSAGWTASLDDVLILFIQADNDYVEIGRVDN